MVNVGKSTIHGSFGTQVKLETNNHGLLDVHTLPFLGDKSIVGNAHHVTMFSQKSPPRRRIEGLEHTCGSRALRWPRYKRSNPRLGFRWYFSRHGKNSDVYNVKLHSQGTRKHIPPKRQSRKIIDSKVIDLMGYVSSQEGKVNKIDIRIIT